MSESRLPSRFPVGTKFIIEAKSSGRSRIYRRHVEFPDGRVLRLPDRSARRVGAVARQRRLRP
jgi:hypothetical protein